MRTNRIRLILPLTLILVGVVYLSHMQPDFVGLDLASYETVLYTNDFLNTSWRLLGDLRGKLVPGYFAPLSSVTLIYDKALIGSDLPDARITLAVNLLFHCLNGILLFLLLTRLGASGFAASAAACVFLLHPMQAPCVMWFAERKTVMAACFSFLSYLAYLKYRRTQSRHFYALSLAAFVGGLLSKPTAVVLPAILLVGEWLGLHRAVAPTHNGSHEPKGFRHWVDRTQLIPLAPFFVLALGISVVTLRTEAADLVNLPVLQRPFIASAALWFYLYKIVWPLNLLELYPKWDVNFRDFLWWISLVFSAVSVWAVVRYRRQISGQFRWGLAFFVIPLLPVVGAVKFGYFQHAYVGNHLAYLSIAGAAFCLALLAEGLRQWAGPKVGTLVAAGLLVYMAFLFVLTWRQAGIWSDPIGLWRHNVAQCSSCARARLMLGHALRDSNQLDQASKEYEEILRSAPTHNQARHGLALARLSQNRLGDAARLLEEAVAHNPTSPASQNSLAFVLLQQGRAAEATQLFEELMERWPQFEKPYLTLAQEMARRKEYAEAERLLKKAITVNPDFAAAYATLADVRLFQGELEEAQELARRAIRLRADYAMAYNTLGQVTLIQARADESVELFRRALRSQPTAPEPHLNLGAAFMALGRFPEARESFEAAIRLRPQFAEAHANLGFALMNLRNSDAAIEHLQKALDMNPGLDRARVVLEEARKVTGTRLRLENHTAPR